MNGWLPILSLIGTILVTGVGSTWTISRYFAKLRGDIDELKEGQRVLMESKFSLTGASEQALRAAIENPGFRVPDPRDPSKIIVVNGAAKV